MHVVVVGNGVAGMEAALGVRAREPEARITIVSEESDHFFSRTALMYVLSGQMSYRDIEPLERDVYRRMRFERERCRAVGLDPVAHELRLADGRALRYDRLLVACGSRPRKGPWPGSELDGVGHFVTMQDLQWLEGELHGRHGVDQPPNPDAHLTPPDPTSPYARRAVAAKKRGKLAQRPIVIGGGLIGIEAVEVFLAAKRPVSFVVREEWFWPVALDARESTFVADALRHHGVDVKLRANVERLVGDSNGAVCRVETDQGPIEADLAVVAIGVQPNTDWLGEAVARDAGGGILVDEKLQTSAPDVYAAGDCASVRWFNGWVRPEQLWYTSRDQGRVAAKALLGDDVGYRRGSWYNSAKLMDLEYTTAGLVNMKVPGEESWYFEEKGAVHSTTRIVHVDGRVVGFNFLGRRWDHEVCLRWIDERRALPWVLAHLNEARYDTEFVPLLRIPSQTLTRSEA